MDAGAAAGGGTLRFESGAALMLPLADAGAGGTVPGFEGSSLTTTSPESSRPGRFVNGSMILRASLNPVPLADAKPEPGILAQKVPRLVDAKNPTFSEGSQVCSPVSF